LKGKEGSEEAIQNKLDKIMLEFGLDLAAPIENNHRNIVGFCD
jgi:hypothetical protein